MKVDILATEAYMYIAELSEVAAQPGTYHFTINSVWRGAKDPQEERVAFRATLDSAGLAASSTLIEAVVGS